MTTLYDWLNKQQNFTESIPKKYLTKSIKKLFDLCYVCRHEIYTYIWQLPNNEATIVLQIDPDYYIKHIFYSSLNPLYGRLSHRTNGPQHYDINTITWIFYNRTGPLC